MFSQQSDSTENEDGKKEPLDPKIRRKIQNRINQRACRRRKAQLSHNDMKGGERKWTIYFDPSTRTEQPAENTSTSLSLVPSHFCDLNLESRQMILNGLQERVNKGIVNYSLSSDMLLSVTQLNLVTAMFKNAGCMGLTMELLAKDDIASPFNISGPWPVTINLPPSLRPTSLQKETPHHPWVDLCPIPSVRDALLRNMGLYDEDELCDDLFNPHGNHRTSGLVVWGEAWDPLGYEISESLILKWGWLMRESSDVLISTNYWRLKRGDKPISMEKCNQIYEMEV